jgi:hypothetical protein
MPRKKRPSKTKKIKTPPVSPTGKPTTQSIAGQTAPPQSLWAKVKRHVLAGRRGLWRTLGAVALLIGLFVALMYFRQDISVDPYISYNPSDPFSQQLAITNNGPFSIYEVHYACAITHITTNSPKGDTVRNRFISVMLPIAPHVAELRWKQKTSTECDFIRQFKDDLTSINIEISVFYQRRFWPGELHTAGQKFTATRDSDGKFKWNYDSPDENVFDEVKESNPERTVVVIPFIASPSFPNSKDDEETFKSDLEEIVHKTLNSKFDNEHIKLTNYPWPYQWAH